MLKKLSVKNVALIDSAEIVFAEGLNVLSGETGSGKSVILESINFVLGAKADKTLIRSGETECAVVAEFDVSDLQAVKDVFRQFDFDVEDDLIISRKMTSDGKNSIKINGNTATAAMLKKFTAVLVDVHGQSEHFALLKNSNQLSLIDRFGGEENGAVKTKLSQKYSTYKNILENLSALGGSESERLVRLDILKYQIEEINSLNLSDGEEEKLEEQRKKLINQEKIVSALSTVKNCFDGEQSVDEVLSEARRNLSSVVAYSKEYSDLFDRFSSALLELKDVASSASDYLDNFDGAEFGLDAVEERLEAIKTVKRKYGGTVESVKNYLEDALKEQDRLIHFNEIASDLLRQKAQAENEIYSLSQSLSEIRKKSALVFSDNIKKELRELGMGSADFFVQFAQFPTQNDCSFNSSNGFDDIEFMFSANKGEPVKPLSAVISGGEMSRFMLAIKAQTAKYNDISTFIFDEIDSGISGATAKIVAEKFANISRDTQLIAITHLPQISAMADVNIYIEKTEIGEKTLTCVKTLNSEEKIDEIIRLVGGDASSVSAKTLATELIRQASLYKNNLE